MTPMKYNALEYEVSSKKQIIKNFDLAKGKKV